jgi:hypothetical protein
MAARRFGVSSEQCSLDGYQRAVTSASPRDYANLGTPFLRPLLQLKSPTVLWRSRVPRLVDVSKRRASAP